MIGVFGRRTEKRKLIRIIEALRETSVHAGITRYADIAGRLDRMMSSGSFEVDEVTARDIIIALDLYSICRPAGAPRRDDDITELGNEYAKIFLRTYKVSVYPD